MSWAVQLTCYAHGVPWDIEHDRPASHTWPPVTQTEGIILHLPNDRPGQPMIHTVDLKKGLELTQLAKHVKQARKQKTVNTIWKKN